ncbi:MAG: hypothetical protein HYX28_05780 [Candidatus Koribacter versatilis]|uniref:Uncharacterized protein n=1 Tax=Candidatus Korobacter versatilis TaxID=658062 RepID=A0A932A8Z0_9BACT|nr:hypothetical protein [Candidatus Koribacter versatilis]
MPETALRPAADLATTSTTDEPSTHTSTPPSTPSLETGNSKLETASLTPARRQRDLARRHAELAPRCCHIKTNGLPCRSPALRGNVLCFFHDKWLNHAADDILPPLEDGNGVQFALMYMVTRLRREAFRDAEVNVPIVKQILYALQTASHNLRYVNFDPRLKSSCTDPYAAESAHDDAQSAAL